MRATTIRSAVILAAVSAFSTARAQAPGDDFFAYANSAWLKSATIPAGKQRWGAREEIFDITRQRVVQLLEDARTAPAGSTARKVADFRTAYANQAAIEARGITSLKPLLD